MAFQQQAFAAPEGDEVGSQFSGAPGDMSGFVGAPAGYSGYPLVYGGYPQTFAAPQATYLPAQPVYEVPLPVRRPGYNERYVAWKNRQKAFNRYKQATKAAIKNARNQPAAAPFGYGPAWNVAPTFVPQQATYLPQGDYMPFAGGYPTYGYPTASYGGDFTSYSETSQAQQAEPQVAHEEPEIRGTQV